MELHSPTICCVATVAIPQTLCMFVPCLSGQTHPLIHGDMHMSQFEKPTDKSKLETIAGSLMLLSFGLGILAFLIAIDRPEWFTLRPASGTAAAMSKASDTQTHKQVGQ